MTEKIVTIQPIGETGEKAEIVAELLRNKIASGEDVSQPVIIAPIPIVNIDVPTNNPYEVQKAFLEKGKELPPNLREQYNRIVEDRNNSNFDAYSTNQPASERERRIADTKKNYQKVTNEFLQKANEQIIAQNNKHLEPYGQVYYYGSILSKQQAQDIEQAVQNIASKKIRDRDKEGDTDYYNTLTTNIRSGFLGKIGSGHSNPFEKNVPNVPTKPSGTYIPTDTVSIKSIDTLPISSNEATNKALLGQGINKDITGGTSEQEFYILTTSKEFQKEIFEKQGYDVKQKDYSTELTKGDIKKTIDNKGETTLKAPSSATLRPEFITDDIKNIPPMSFERKEILEDARLGRQPISYENPEILRNILDNADKSLQKIPPNSIGIAGKPTIYNVLGKVDGYIARTLSQDRYQSSAELSKNILGNIRTSAQDVIGIPSYTWNNIFGENDRQAIVQAIEMHIPFKSWKLAGRVSALRKEGDFESANTYLQEQIDKQNYNKYGERRRAGLELVKDWSNFYADHPYLLTGVSQAIHYGTPYTTGIIAKTTVGNMKKVSKFIPKLDKFIPSESTLIHTGETAIKQGLIYGIPANEYFNAVKEGRERGLSELQVQNTAQARALSALLLTKGISSALERYQQSEEFRQAKRKATKEGKITEFKKDLKDIQELTKLSKQYERKDAYLDHITTDKKKKEIIIQALDKYKLAIGGSTSSQPYSKIEPNDLDLLIRKPIWSKMPVIGEYYISNPSKKIIKLTDFLESKGVDIDTKITKEKKLRNITKWFRLKNREGKLTKQESIKKIKETFTDEPDLWEFEESLKSAKDQDIIIKQYLSKKGIKDPGKYISFEPYEKVYTEKPKITLNKESPFRWRDFATKNPVQIRKQLDTYQQIGKYGNFYLNGKKVELHTAEWHNLFPKKYPLIKNKDGTITLNPKEQLYRKLIGAYGRGRGKDIDYLHTLIDKLPEYQRQGKLSIPESFIRMINSKKASLGLQNVPNDILQETITETKYKLKERPDIADLHASMKFFSRDQITNFLFAQGAGRSPIYRDFPYFNVVKRIKTPVFNLQKDYQPKSKIPEEYILSDKPQEAAKYSQKINNRDYKYIPIKLKYTAIPNYKYKPTVQYQYQLDKKYSPYKGTKGYIPYSPYTEYTPYSQYSSYENYASYPPYTPYTPHTYTPYTPYPPSTPPPTTGTISTNTEKKLSKRSIAVTSRDYERKGKPKDIIVGAGKALKDAIGIGQKYVDENPDTSFSLIPSNKKGDTHKGPNLNYKFTLRHGRWFEKNQYRYDRNKEQTIFFRMKRIKTTSY